jgi:Flp pilus assembly protein TadB
MSSIFVDAIDLVTETLKWLHGGVRGSRDDQPALITTAPPASGDEYEQRRKKYAIMMALRAVCIVLAAVTYRESIPLAVALLVGGAVLPWCAVLIANNRPPKRRRATLGRVSLPPDRSLPSGHDDRTVDG